MLDYRPDWRPTDPSILSACAYLVPQRGGDYLTSFAAETSSYDTALNGNCLGAKFLKDASGNDYALFGSASKIQKANGAGGWTDISGAAYTTGTNRWWFEAYGDSLLATNYADTIQVSASGAAFANLSGAPKAKGLLVQSGFLIAVAYNDGSAVLNGIKWASQGTTTSWTAATNNTAGTAKLVESPGHITAWATINDIIVLWKRRSMYVGRRVATSEIWKVNQLSPSVGCVSQEAWISTPAGIIFVSELGIFLFDGGGIPRPIDDGIRHYFYNISCASSTALASIQMTHDELLGAIFIWIPGGDCWCYSYIANKWSIPYSGTVLGNSSYRTFQNNVRDASFDSMRALGFAAGANAEKRCHLVVSSEKKVPNLAFATPADGISFSITIPYLRHPKAGPRDQTTISRICPMWGSWSLGQTYREPSAASASLTAYSRITGGSQGSKSLTMDAEKAFDCDGPQSANTFALTISGTNVAAAIADVAYEWKTAGHR